MDTSDTAITVAVKGMDEALERLKETNSLLQLIVHALEDIAFKTR